MHQAHQSEKLTATAALWQQRIKDWETSGLTQVAFCQQHDLRHETFKNWRKHDHFIAAVIVISVAVKSEPNWMNVPTWLEWPKMRF